MQQNFKLQGVQFEFIEVNEMFYFTITNIVNATSVFEDHVIELKTENFMIKNHVTLEFNIDFLRISDLNMLEVD